jgi:hypothetical protein
MTPMHAKRHLWTCGLCLPSFLLSSIRYSFIFNPGVLNKKPLPPPLLRKNMSDEDLGDTNQPWRPVSPRAPFISLSNSQPRGSFDTAWNPRMSLSLSPPLTSASAQRNMSAQRQKIPRSTSSDSSYPLISPPTLLTNHVSSQIISWPRVPWWIARHWEQDSRQLN